MANIDISNIECVYVGKPGCMCGCNGEYYYNADSATEDHHTVNVDKVQRVANKVLKNPDTVRDSQGNVSWAELQLKSRNLVIYFKGVK